MTQVLEASSRSTPRTGHDKRTAVRYPVDPDKCWNINLVVGEDLHFATVHNLSLRGIGLVLERDLPPGTCASAELTGLSGLVSFSEKMQVKHVTALPQGGYLVGCKFDTPLTGEHVRALLERD